MLAKKKKLRESTSMSEEAPLFGGFAGVLLTTEVFGATSFLVTGAGRGGVAPARRGGVAAAPGRGGVAAPGFTLVVLSPKTPICICKRIAVLRRM